MRRDPLSFGSFFETEFCDPDTLCEMLVYRLHTTKLEIVFFIRTSPGTRIPKPFFRKLTTFKL